MNVAGERLGDLGIKPDIKSGESILGKPAIGRPQEAERGAGRAMRPARTAWEQSISASIIASEHRYHPRGGDMASAIISSVGGMRETA